MPCSQHGCDYSWCKVGLFYSHYKKSMKWLHTSLKRLPIFFLRTWKMTNFAAVFSNHINIFL